MSVALRPRTALSLFSGAGGLDLAVRISEPQCRTLAYCERDPYAAAILVARMEDEALDHAPVWDDVVTFPSEQFRGRVDLVHGGFPCQDISVAGAGAGLDGDRSGLWFAMLDVIRDVECRWMFLENVSALVTRGLDRVLADLAALGFDAVPAWVDGEWTTLRASDVGAPHRRERCFILARRASDAERDTVRVEPERGAGRAPATLERDAESRLVGAEHLADPGSERPQGQPRRGATPGATGRGDGAAFPPGPGDRSAWQRILADRPDLAPAIESGVRVLVDGVAYVVDAYRTDALRACGNGVVPRQGAAAYRLLRRRLLG